MAILQGDAELAAPRDRTEEPRLVGRECLQALGDVVQRPPETWQVAAGFRVQSAAAAVEEVDLVTGGGDLRTRPRIPAAVALDAVQEDHPADRFGRRGVAPVVPAVAVRR